MKNIYGFKLLNKDGNGIKRWFNGETQLVTNNPLGRLPGILHSINIAQNVLDFESSFNYCRSTSKEYNLNFAELTEKDWNAIQHPIKRFFKGLVKKVKQWNKLN